MAEQKVRLLYTSGRGLAETIRMMLCSASIEFEDEFLRDRTHFLELQSADEFLFKQVPVLYIDGLKLVQTRAIILYLARKAGMLGTNDIETVRVDMLAEGAADYQAKFPFVGFGDEDAQLKEIKETVLPRYMPIFDKLLSENGTGFLVGDSMTLADIRLLEPLLATIDYFGIEALDKFPGLQNFHKTMLDDDRIQHYIKNVRYPKNTREYVAYVKGIHNMK